ncbi:MAG: hypothetical protein AAFU73_07350 [Planctomycetota bacterium]
MDFLLECIGFPPDLGEDDVAELVRTRGEAAAWRGAGEDHRVLALGQGLHGQSLVVRADRDGPGGQWSLTPELRGTRPRRLAVTSIVRPQDQPFDALLTGWAHPPPPGEDPEGPPGAYRLSAWVSDARRIGRRLLPGHVLAVEAAGFALHVERIVAGDAAFAASVLERPSGAYVRPLGAPDDPGGGCDVSLRIQSVRRLVNAVTDEVVVVALCDAPDRPIPLLLSPWQLDRDGHERPRPGLRVEGTFLFTGRIAGGLKRGTTGDRFG